MSEQNQNWVYYECDDAPSGPGVYYWDENDLDKGAHGPFISLAAAVKDSLGFSSIIPVQHNFDLTGVSGIEVTELELVYLDDE